MTRLWPKRLGAQLALLLLLALIAGQVVTFAIFADVRFAAVIAANRGQVIGRTLAVVRLLDALPPSMHARAVAASSGRGFEVRLEDRPAIDGDDDHPNPIERRLQGALRGAGVGEVRAEVEDFEHRGYRRRGHKEPLSLVLAIELGPGRWLNLEHRLVPPPGNWALPALTYLGVTALLITLIALVVARRIGRPLKDLADAADRLGRGEATPPLSERGPEEIRRTAAAFNGMQARLKRFVEDRVTMLAAMSHDLRTPVTALRLRAELLDDAVERERFVATLDEMAAMVEASLAFARDAASAEPTGPVELAALASSVAEDLIETGAMIEVAEMPRTVLRVRPHALKRALRNVLENAVRYGGRATLDLAQTKVDVRLIVEDGGPGIPDGAIERMFQPFVRLEESRSRETGGLGLGLAIARDALRAHGGDIVLSNRVEGGLRATLILPRA